MTRVLRLIGYWDGPAAPDGLPDVCEFVDPTADPGVQRSVAAYLRSGTVRAAAAGISPCRLCGGRNGNTEQTDGAHFIWPEGLAHYVEAHGVVLPDEVAAVAAGGPAPAVDLDRLRDGGELTVDLRWWRSRPGVPRPAGAATPHLLGCHRNPAVAGWDLPTAADIHVDRVPPDAVAVLARLRRLLGADWPVSGLRGLIAGQPFLAVAGGDPHALHRALTAAPELRPYLFYAADGGLLPVWSDG
jgi:hypothetical protein